MEFIETAIFSRQVARALSDEAYWLLQWQLILRPDTGDIIRGSGGLRKLRCRLPGRGKRGGARVIYYWKPGSRQIFLLFLYPKNARETLSFTELRMLRELVAADG
jgi:hypothetical protein